MHRLGQLARLACVIKVGEDDLPLSEKARQTLLPRGAIRSDRIIKRDADDLDRALPEALRNVVEAPDLRDARSAPGRPKAHDAHARIGTKRLLDLIGAAHF